MIDVVVGQVLDDVVSEVEKSEEHDRRPNSVVRQLFPESLQSCEECGFIGLNENDCSKRCSGDFLCIMCWEKQEEAQEAVRQSEIEDGEICENEILVDEPVSGSDGISRVTITYPDGQEQIFEVTGEPWPPQRQPPEPSCDICSRTQTAIESRGCWEDSEGAETDKIVDRGDYSVCLSCIIAEDKPHARTLFGNCPDWGKNCVDCGYSSLIHSMRFGEHTVWKEDVDGLGVPCSRCPDCSEREIRTTEANTQEDIEGAEIMCAYCSHVWDGNAQCPCNLGLSDSELSDSEDEDWPYGEEYVLDDEPPENNSEKVKAVKETVKEIGEKLFDISSEIKEGTYLALMDSLQKLNNGVNDL